MTVAKHLHAAKKRFFANPSSCPGEALRSDVDYPIYCRALFLLKRGLGIEPMDTIFAWHRGSLRSLDTIKNGFDRAIMLAEAEAP